MPAARPSESVIRNAIKAAQSCGLMIGAVTVGKDGSVRVDTSTETDEPLDKPIANEPPARPKLWAQRG